MTKSCCIEKPADNESTTGGLSEPVTLTQTLSVSSAPSIQLSESNIGLDFTPSGAEFINSDNRVTYGIVDIGTQMNYFWRERGTSNTMMFLSETNNLQVVDGTNTNPGYTFLSDPDTGIYRSGTNILSVTTGGSDKMRVFPTFTDFKTPVVLDTSGQSLSNVNLQVQDSSQGLFASDANAISLVQNTTEYIKCGTFSGLEFGSNLKAPDGSISSPSYSFSNDTDTGLYRSGADQLELTAGGIGVMTLTSTGWNSSVQPRFYVKPAATLGFSVPTTTDQLLPGSFWGTPDYSVGYTSFTNGILTIAEDGYYVVSFNVTFLANGSGGRIARVNNLTTGEFLAYQSVAPSPGSLSTNLAGTWVGFLSAGDQLQPLVRQDSGINLTIGVPTRNSFSVFKLY